LEALGFRVVLAAHGEEAIELFRGAPASFRLVLLDLTMPRLGGEEVFRELRQLRPDVRVLLMSGYAELEVATRFAGQGLAGGSADSPSCVRALVAKVRRALAPSPQAGRLGPRRGGLPPPAGGALSCRDARPRPPRPPAEEAPRAPMAGLLPRAAAARRGRVAR